MASTWLVFMFGVSFTMDTSLKSGVVYDARFYELGLTRELTNPRVGVIPSLNSG